MIQKSEQQCSIFPYLKFGDHSDHFVVSSGSHPFGININKHAVHQRVLRLLQ